MTKLPQGWTLARLDQVTTPRGEKADPSTLGDLPFLGMDHIEANTANLLGSQPVSELKSAVAVFKAGDLLYGRLRSYLNKVHLAGFDGAASAEFIVFPPQPAIEQRYLQCILRSPEYRAIADQRSTGDRPRVKFENVGDYPIPLPPLLEQRRIVHKLDTLSARSTTARTHLTAIEKLVERYKQSVLGQFFPDDIPTKPLGVSCTKIGSGATPRGGKNVYLPEGTPLIRSQNVRFGGFDWDGLAFISDEHADELRNVTVRTGDVLLNITGASIGRVCRAPEAMDGARVNQHVSIIRPRSQELDACFIQYFLSSPVIQNWIWNENYGVTRQALTKGMIEDINIPDISPEEQREIVRRIETAFAKIDRLAAEAAKALKLLGHLDQRLLAKAFAGDLVPQDPNDEPASVLLDRIREARALALAPKKSRKRRTKVNAMKEDPKDRLLADSATWPKGGLPFEDIAKRVMMPHDDVRDALFELLGGARPQLEQVFDTSQERMRLKRVAQ